MSLFLLIDHRIRKSNVIPLKPSRKYFILYYWIWIVQTGSLKILYFEVFFISLQVSFSSNSLFLFVLLWKNVVWEVCLSVMQKHVKFNNITRRSWFCSDTTRLIFNTFFHWFCVHNLMYDYLECMNKKCDEYFFD